jgi:L-rhamnose mutarotase
VSADAPELRKVCFLLRIDPARREEYLAAHENVWPEMVQALRESGYRRYSLFLDDSGLLVGYFETEDAEATLATMAATDVAKRWSAMIGDLFLPVDERRPVDTVLPLLHAFDLDQQLIGQSA